MKEREREREIDREIYIDRDREREKRETWINLKEKNVIAILGLILFELHSTIVMLANMEFERKHNANQLLMR